PVLAASKGDGDAASGRHGIGADPAQRRYLHRQSEALSRRRAARERGRSAPGAGGGASLNREVTRLCRKTVLRDDVREKNLDNSAGRLAFTALRWPLVDLPVKP